MKQTLFFSVDIETDGPIPGDYSMLSIGCAVFDSDGNQLGTFYENLELQEEASSHPDTMKFWSENQEAYDTTRVNMKHAKVVMSDFVNWVDSFRCKPVFVAYPSGFDWTFTYWMMMHYVGRSPFSFSALDIKSYASAVMKCDFRDATKKNMPKKWKPNLPHTHHALDDAIEQGLLFINMRKDALGRK